MNVVLVCPVPSGGHALYITELATALTRLPENVRVEVVAPSDLEDRYRTGLYPVHTVLPVWPASQPKNVLARQMTLASYSLRFERACVRWLRQRPEIDVLHFQSLYWLDAPLMYCYRRLGAALVNKYGIYTSTIGNEEYTGLRITPNIYTTLKEIDVFADAVEREVKIA